jgi:hypothetical protein
MAVGIVRLTWRRLALENSEEVDDDVALTGGHAVDLLYRRFL